MIPSRRPTPSWAPFRKAPFYGVALLPTPLATSMGLRIITDAQVLKPQGLPIPGLYAAGNEAASVMGYEYPGAGVQVGSALTFAWPAARHAAGSRGDNRHPAQHTPVPHQTGAPVASTNDVVMTAAARRRRLVVMKGSLSVRNF